MTTKKEYGQNSVATSAVATICEKYGFPFHSEDLEYDNFERMWYFTPYAGDSGFKCQDGLWWGVNIDSYNVRFMDGDFDMFDEIAKALA